MGLMARLVAAAMAGLSGAREALNRAFVAGDVPERTMKKVASHAEMAKLSGNRPWRGVLRRKAAPSSGTRQNERREWFRQACKTISEKYPGESRAVRRRMARAMGNRIWRKEHGLREAWEPEMDGRKYRNVRSAAMVALGHG